MKDLAEGNKSDGWASWKEYPAVRDLVAKNGALKRVLSKVTTVLQVTPTGRMPQRDQPALEASPAQRGPAAIPRIAHVIDRYHRSV